MQFLQRYLIRRVETRWQMTQAMAGLGIAIALFFSFIFLLIGIFSDHTSLLEGLLYALASGAFTISAMLAVGLLLDVTELHSEWAPDNALADPREALLVLLFKREGNESGRGLQHKDGSWAAGVIGKPLFETAIEDLSDRGFVQMTHGSWFLTKAGRTFIRERCIALYDVGMSYYLHDDAGPFPEASSALQEVIEKKTRAWHRYHLVLKWMLGLVVAGLVFVVVMDWIGMPIHR